MSVKVKVLALVLSTCFATSSLADDAQILTLQRNLLNLQNQVQDLQDKLAESQGQVEFLNYQIKNLQDENASLKDKLQSQTAAVNSNDNAQATDGKAEQNANEIKVNTVVGTAGATLTKKDSATKASVNNSASTVDKEAQALYQSAYDKMMKNNFVKAKEEFYKFVQTYSDTSLTPNAWYWVGQIEYRQKNYQEARLAFLNTAKFKNSAKRADALYKLGLTSKALGDNDKAKKYYEVLIKSYPNSSSAILAKKELQSL